MSRNQVSQVILLDVSTSMLEHLPSIRQTLAGYLVSKMHGSPKHEVGLVSFGTSGTDNAVHDEVGDPLQYTCISTAWAVKPPTKDELRIVSKLTCGTGAADVAEALVVAVDLHKRHREAALRKASQISSSVTLVSSFASATGDADAEFLDSVIEHMQSLQLSLEILQLPGSSDGPLAKCVPALEYLVSNLPSCTLTQVKGAAQLLSCFKAREVLPTTLFRGPLAIAPQLEIPVYVYKKTSEVRLPSTKLYSDRAEKGAPSATHEVRIDTDFKSAADPDVSVPPEERVRAFPYGKQMVPMDESQERLLRFSAEKGFRVLGFVPRDQAPRHQFMADTNVVLPEPGNDRAARGISAVARAMARSGQVAIARATWRSNTSTVAIGALTPCLGGLHHADCMYFNVLPFMEDSRSLAFPSFSDGKHKPSKAQLRAAEQLIRRMDLGCGQSEQLAPESTGNPTLAYFHQVIAERMLEEPIGGDAGTRLRPALRCPFEGAEDLKAVGEALAESLSQEVAAVSGKDPETGSGLGDRLVEAAAPVKSDDREMMRSITEPAVGVLTPVRDFRQMMARPDRRVAALDGIKQVAARLVSESSGRRSFGTAVECVRALREACTGLGAAESDAFNAFLKSLRDRFGSDPARQLFWSDLIAAGICFISWKEVPGCHCRPDDAVSLLQPQGIKEEDQKPIKSEPVDENRDVKEEVEQEEEKQCYDF